MSRRALLLVLLLSCGLGDFDPPSKIESVRILASRADKPYAKPGDTVNVDLLTYDGRTDQSRPMRVSWIPIVCPDPPFDAYYGCFVGLEQAAKNGGMVMGVPLTPGTDLTPFLPTGTSFSITLPSNLIDAHRPVPGAADPYGVAFVFNAACAGHLEIVDATATGNPQASPIGCFDDQHNALGADDFVFGFTRVYAYADRTNANPVITSVVVNGLQVDPAQGATLDHCAPSGCSDISVDIVVPDASDELNPGDVGPDGVPHHEQIWVDFFATTGKFAHDARLLFDPVMGRISADPNTWTPPSDPGEQHMWLVVHDNRGGANWIDFALHVK